MPSSHRDQGLDYAPALEPHARGSERDGRSTNSFTDRASQQSAPYPIAAAGGGPAPSWCRVYPNIGESAPLYYTDIPETPPRDSGQQQGTTLSHPTRLRPASTTGPGYATTAGRVTLPNVQPFKQRVTDHDGDGSATMTPVNFPPALSALGVQGLRKPRASVVQLDGFGSFPVVGAGGQKPRPSAFPRPSHAATTAAAAIAAVSAGVRGGGQPPQLCSPSPFFRPSHASAGSAFGVGSHPNRVFPGTASSMTAGAEVFLPPAALLSPGAVRSSVMQRPSADSSFAVLRETSNRASQFKRGTLDPIPDHFPSPGGRVAPEPLTDPLTGADATDTDTFTRDGGDSPLTGNGGMGTSRSRGSIMSRLGLRAKEKKRPAASGRSVSFGLGKTSDATKTPRHGSTFNAPSSSSSTKRNSASTRRHAPPLARQKSTLERAQGMTRTVSKFVGRSFSRIRGSPETEGQETRAQRLWGVVRRVVLVDFEHGDVGSAFEALHTSTGRRDSTIQDPTRYLMLWKAARIHFIRLRLRGEWFPPDAYKKPSGRFLLHPNGYPRRIWDSVLLLFVVFNAAEVPFVVGLAPPESLVLSTINHVITGLFAVDIGLAFNTAILEVNADRKEIARQYFHTWFWIDVVSTIPFDTIITFAIGHASGGEDQGRLRLLGFLKTPRLLRLSKLLRFMDKLKGAQFYKMLKLIFLIVIISHWVACAYCLVAGLESSGPTWVDVSVEAAPDNQFYIPHGKGFILRLYSSAFYQAWTMLTGNGAFCFTVEERFFVSTVMMLGGFVQAVIVGNIALLVTNLDAAAARCRSESDSVMSTAKYLELPPALLERIHDYYDFMQGASHPGRDGMRDLGKLPKKLFEDIVFHMHGPALDAVPLLRGLEPSFLAELSQRISSHLLLPDEAVFKEGDVSREMYFIVHGTCAVGDDSGGQDQSHRAAKIDGGVVSVLHAGSFFGELALLTDIRRSSTVLAITVCDINILTRASLVEVLSEFPEVERTVRQRGRRRLHELQETNEIESMFAEPGGGGDALGAGDDAGGADGFDRRGPGDGGSGGGSVSAVGAMSPRGNNRHNGHEELMLKQGVGALDAELDEYEGLRHGFPSRGAALGSGGGGGGAGGGPGAGAESNGVAGKHGALLLRAQLKSIRSLQHFPPYDSANANHQVDLVDSSASGGGGGAAAGGSARVLHHHNGGMSGLNGTQGSSRGGAVATVVTWSGPSMDGAATAVAPYSTHRSQPEGGSGLYSGSGASLRGGSGGGPARLGPAPSLLENDAEGGSQHDRRVPSLLDDDATEAGHRQHAAPAMGETSRVLAAAIAESLVGAAEAAEEERAAAAAEPLLRRAAEDFQASSANHPGGGGLTGNGGGAQMTSSGQLRLQRISSGRRHSFDEGYPLLSQHERTSSQGSGGGGEPPLKIMPDTREFALRRGEMAGAQSSQHSSSTDAAGVVMVTVSVLGRGVSHSGDTASAEAAAVKIAAPAASGGGGGGENC